MRARATPIAEAPKAAEMFSEDELTAFLDLIASGVGRALAAQRIGSTGTVMRRLCNPDRDPEFARRYEEAVAEGKVFYPDRLAAESRTRALSGSDRLLEVELATHHPDYRHLRRDRMTHEGKLDLEHSVVIRLDPAVLDGMTREELLEARETLLRLNGGDPLQGELPSGE